MERRESLSCASLSCPYPTRESYFPAQAEPLSMHIKNCGNSHSPRKIIFRLRSFSSTWPLFDSVLFSRPHATLLSSLCFLSTIIISRLNNSSLIVKYVFLTHTLWVVHWVKLVLRSSEDLMFCDKFTPNHSKGLYTMHIKSQSHDLYTRVKGRRQQQKIAAWSLAWANVMQQHETETPHTSIERRRLVERKRFSLINLNWV